MAIVTISEALLQKLSSSDRRLLRDKILCGFCVQANKRTRTFLVATSAKGQQVRITLGRWPLMSVEEARSRAMVILRECRAGQVPQRQAPKPLPTVREALAGYCDAKGIKASSRARYESLMRTHFSDWLARPVTSLNDRQFAESCHTFAQTKGAALVEVGRGLIGAFIKYLNAVHHLSLESPFARLAAAGLLPDRAQPRARKLQESQLRAWRESVDRLPEPQRDFALLLALTGLRRNECFDIKKADVDWQGSILHIPETKNGRSHTLPITTAIRPILERRCAAADEHGSLFHQVCAEHVADMAMRLGAPKFTLHDLRKLLATVGERLSVGDSVLRRILNHTAKRSDVLHRHYVSLDVGDIAQPLAIIQSSLLAAMESDEHSH